MDGRIRSLERWIVVFIAVHSAGVGLLLLLAPEWSADFGGWAAAAPLFFTRQAGVFHIVVAVGYTLEHVVEKLNAFYRAPVDAGAHALALSRSGT